MILRTLFLLTDSPEGVIWEKQREQRQGTGGSPKQPEASLVLGLLWGLNS